MRLLIRPAGGYMKYIGARGLFILCAIFIAVLPAHSWPHTSNQSDNYFNWDTYTYEIDGPGKDEFKMEINSTQEGIFKFAWRIQNLSQSNFEFLKNSQKQARCKSNEFTESEIYNVKEGDILIWRFSYLGTKSNKVWLAFPINYAIQISKEAGKPEFYSASSNESPRISSSLIDPVGAINDTRILPKNKVSNILIEPIWPEEGTILSMDFPIPFKFLPLNLTRIPYCTLVVDNKPIYINNRSRNIELNKINVFEKEIMELGWHSWAISCSDCQGKLSSSRNIFFNIQNENNTTYANKYSPNPGCFSYSKLKDAINNVRPGGTVYIENGSFDEKIVISKPLKLIGTSRSCIDLLGKNGDMIAIKIDSSDVEIKNLTFKNCNIAIQAGTNRSKSGSNLQNICLLNNKIYNCSIGFEISNCDNLYITKNILENFTNKARYILDAISLKECNNYSFNSNYINKNGTLNMLTCCIYLDSCGKPSLDYNEFYNSRYAVCYYNMENRLDLLDLELNYNKFDNSSILNPICEGTCE